MEQKLKILLLEDVETDATLVQRELTKAGILFVPCCVDGREGFLAQLSEFRPNVILADYTLPHFSALEALRLLKELSSDVPLILVTGSHSEEVAVECMREGAEDYILKDSLRRLPSAVLNAVRKRAGERERRAAREALRRSEEQYRLIAENTRDLICIIDLQMTVLYASPSHRSVLGYAPNDLLAKSISDVIHPDDAQTWRNTLDEALFLKEGRTAELRFRNAYDHWQLFESVVSFIFDDHGRPQRTLVASRDTSDRKQAEREIRKLAAFPRFNPNPVLEFSADGSLTYFNTAALEMAKSLKRHPEAILPLNIATIVKMCLTTGQNTLHLETLVNGRTISWSFFPVIANQVVHCYAEDVTASRNLEAQLRQVQKMESIGQLAAGVAHDFNNILTVIQGHAGLMLADPKIGGSFAESARQISAAAERASTLTRQLLLFSRRQTMQPQLLDLNDVIRSVSKMLRALVGEQVRICRELNPELPAVNADAGMIEQVLVNLAVNARDAMLPRGGTLTLRTFVRRIDDEFVATHPEAKPGYVIGLSVEDTGHGMDSSTLSRIFEPFFTTKEIGKGTGLGLATVYGIIKQHQGWIDVRSEIAKGTTFTIFLPASSRARPKAVADTATQINVPGGHETILVVEDETPLRELVREILEKKGYNVLESATGLQALKLWEARRQTIDLLLTDMMMPEGISGRELAEKLLAEKPSLKVIYTSGYSMDAVSPGFTLQEGVNFLQKPYPPNALTKMVRERLDVA
ncbi:MAG: response regulator [Verrucomicrobia subdivision 3 bacterium]|nr:response regulator [Limisphaerales bacterium]